MNHWNCSTLLMRFPGLREGLRSSVMGVHLKRSFAIAAELDWNIISNFFVQIYVVK